MNQQDKNKIYLDQIKHKLEYLEALTLGAGHPATVDPTPNASQTQQIETIRRDAYE
ncbi:MAG: hypothetical protein LBH79_00820 [Nitrososphaerota archaeon]|jgi:hypothetical protein|nr:hypothetical protein [Nitrososphaerota archaeon]